MKIALLVILAIVVIAISSLIVQNLRTPTHLGHNNGILAPMPSKPNAVSSQTSDANKKVEALPYKATHEETLAKVTSVLQAMKGNEVQASDNNYIYSIFTTPTMRYHDDVELYLDETAQLVHFRSQSRAGYSDRGLNRKRYQEFRELYLK